jgi:hypothetical protein
MYCDLRRQFCLFVGVAPCAGHKTSPRLNTDDAQASASSGRLESFDGKYNDCYRTHDTSAMQSSVFDSFQAWGPERMAVPSPGVELNYNCVSVLVLSLFIGDRGPRFVRVEHFHVLELVEGVRPNVFFVDNAIVADGEGSHSTYTVLGWRSH